MGSDTINVDTLIIRTMMEAAKSAQEDLRALMEEIKAANAAKRHLRQLIGQVSRDISVNLSKHPRTNEVNALEFPRDGLGSEHEYHEAKIPVVDVTMHGGVQFVTTDLYQGTIDCVAILQSVRDDLTGMLDTTGEMTMGKQLRLQMYMDAYAQTASMISNIQKKLSDAQHAVIANMK